MTLRIEVKPVQSSNLKAIGYDQATQTLAVQFANGTYHFAGVDAQLFSEFEASESKGRFFQQQIRPHFTGVKQLPIAIEEPAEPEPVVAVVEDPHEDSPREL